jgi:hypothetical protein
MKQLTDTWFIEGYIDFELKKYTLLAYLQEVNAYFNENKLYPQLGDIIFHYNNLAAFRENKKYLQEQFPKRLTGIQIEKLQIVYEQMIKDDELMQELEDIVNYSAGKIQRTISNGTEIYELVEEKLTIFPVGLVPMYTNEGYFFLSDGMLRSIRVYEYSLSIFEKNNTYRAIRTSYIDEWQRNMVNTYESIKAALIRRNKELPNPAVYSIETELSFPVNETLLPIAKRSLVRYISDIAA